MSSSINLQSCANTVRTELEKVAKENKIVQLFGEIKELETQIENKRKQLDSLLGINDIEGRLVSTEDIIGQQLYANDDLIHHINSRRPRT